QTGRQLRRLFVTLLLFCSPATPHHIWLEFKDQICDDLRHRLEQLGQPPDEISDDDIHDYGLF
ncbi:hypothetical protein JOM56_001119, partial [Amanita muscaria]